MRQIRGQYRVPLELKSAGVSRRQYRKHASEFSHLRTKKLKWLYTKSYQFWGGDCVGGDLIFQHLRLLPWQQNRLYVGEVGIWLGATKMLTVIQNNIQTYFNMIWHFYHQRIVCVFPFFFFSGDGQEAGFIYLDLVNKNANTFSTPLAYHENQMNICESTSTTEMKDGS